MDVSSRVAGLAGALVLLVALDVAIARVDVFAPLVGSTVPAGLAGTVNRQLTDVVRALHARPPGPPPVVFLGNSQTEAIVQPVGVLAGRLVDAGAPADTRVMSLCVFATAPTDAEVLTRDLAGLRPGVVVVGIGAPDLGTSIERARTMPIVRTLDTGWRDGLVPPADLDARLDRWVRTAWRLYRYRALLRDLVLPPPERRMPRAFLDSMHTTSEVVAESVGPDEADRVLALRAAFDRSGRYDDFARYVDALRGRDYLSGIRSRWRDLDAEPVQLEALRLTAAHVRAGGGRPVFLLVPENPLFEQDPVVGADVRTRSDRIAARVAAEADAIGVPVVDLRRALGPDAFLDMNHALYDSGTAMPALVAGLAARGVLAGGQPLIR